MRKHVGAVMVGIVVSGAAACASTDTGAAPDTDEVASTRPTSTTTAAPKTAPVLNRRIAADLIATAVTEACRTECTLPDVYVQDHLATADTRLGDEEPMPARIRRAISNELDTVNFVDHGEASAVGAQLADGGDGVLVHVGPVEELAAGVVGVEVGVTTGWNGYHGQTVQFLWTDNGWAVATGEDTGVTVPTSVS